MTIDTTPVSAGQVTVEWTTTQVTSYEKTFNAKDWAEIENPEDELSEFEEMEFETSFSNERSIDLINEKVQ